MLETAECYGLFTRLLGITLAFQIATSGYQLIPLIGRSGVEPISYLIAAYRRDLGTFRGFLKLPSLFWISSDDWMIRFLTILGTLLGIGLFFGLLGEYNPIAFFICWAIWLTFVNSNSNVFGIPWDLLLVEAGFLAIFLPGNESIQNLALMSSPHPLVHFSILFLNFRVMFGMGLNKFKVIDHRTRDGSFVYHFLEWQPFGTKESLYLHNVPMAVHRILLAGLFVSEVVMPWAMFIGPEGRMAFAVSTILLQFGIYACGNFGIFNIMPIILAIPFFANAPLLVLPDLGVLSVVMALHIAGSLPYAFILNSWNQGMWTYVPQRIRSYAPLIAPVASFYRLIAPFRLWCAYGIFTPRHNYPKLLPVIQMSQNGMDWIDVQPKYVRYQPKEIAWHWAPYHPRLDHFFYYTHFRKSDFKVSCLSGLNPYYIHAIGFIDKLVEHLYRGTPQVQTLFESVPFEQPKFIRLGTYGFKLNSVKNLNITGAYWSKELMGVTAPLERIELEPSTGIHDAYHPFICDTLELDDEGCASYEINDERVRLQRSPLRTSLSNEDSEEVRLYKDPNHEFGGV